MSFIEELQFKIRIKLRNAYYRLRYWLTHPEGLQHVSVCSESPHYTPQVRKMRCFIDGTEVTDRCYEASVPGNFVKVYALDYKGQMYILEDDIAKEVIKGRVTLYNNKGEIRI